MCIVEIIATFMSRSSKNVLRDNVKLIFKYILYIITGLNLN